MSSILHSETSPKSQHTHETQHSICPKESTCSSINSSCLFIRSPVLALSGLKTWRCFDWNMGTHKDGSSSVQTNICNWNSPIANSLCHSSLTKCNQLNSNLAFGDNIDNGQKKERGMELRPSQKTIITTDAFSVFNRDLRIINCFLRGSRPGFHLGIDDNTMK